MSVVLTPSASLDPGVAPARSRGVWSAAGWRFRSDRVGMTSLVIVIAFMLLVLAAALGLVARDWQVERGVPDAPPTFIGPAEKTTSAAIAEPTGPSVDISAVD
ncbi:MAG: ABC transporter permease, partial [Caldimonas sp.]